MLHCFRGLYLQLAWTLTGQTLTLSYQFHDKYLWKKPEMLEKRTAFLFFFFSCNNFIHIFPFNLNNLHMLFWLCDPTLLQFTGWRNSEPCTEIMYPFLLLRTKEFCFCDIKMTSGQAMKSSSLQSHYDGFTLQKMWSLSTNHLQK